MFVCALVLLLTAQSIVKSESIPPNTSAIEYSSVDSSSSIATIQKTCGAFCRYAAKSSIVTATAGQHVTDRRGASSVSVITATYIIYHEYSVTTDFMSNGSCVVTKATSYSLQTPFTYTKALSVDLSRAQTAGMSSFGKYLGRGRNCQTGIRRTKFKRASNITLAARINQAPSGILAYSNSTGAPILNTGEKAAIGVVVPFSVIAMTTAAFFLWRLAKRRRQNTSTPEPDHNEKKSDEPQPFIQIKGELLGEDSRHEMSAEAKLYELHDEQVYELYANESDQGKELEAHNKPELNGQEIPHELKA